MLLEVKVKLLLFELKHRVEHGKRGNPSELSPGDHFETVYGAVPRSVRVESILCRCPTPEGAKQP